MGALTTAIRSADHALASVETGSPQLPSLAPRCLTGLSSMLADAMRHPANLAASVAPSGSGKRPRLKWWEIDRSWQCGLLGICLTASELRAIGAKHDSVKAKAKNGADFELHIAVLRFAGRDRDLGKALTKALERKHARFIAQLAEIDDPSELHARWESLVAEGELAGAYWAVMAHPATTEELRLAIASDAHMRLYQAIGTNRAEVRRSQALEREKAEIEAKAARRLTQAREDLTQKDAEIDELRRRLGRRPADGDTTDSVDWRKLATDLQQRIEAEAPRRQAIDEAARQAQVEVRDLRSQLERLTERNDELVAENANLARLDQPESDNDEPLAANANLEGRTILVVGGRTQHIPHYRRLVEDRNGAFIHHDGGIDDSIPRLRGLLGRADAVLFPVDCVSHMAQDELKKLCRRWEKPFVPVRRSGLAAFLTALGTAAAPQRPESGPLPN